MKKDFICLVTLLFFSQSLVAQVNLEKWKVFQVIIGVYKL